VLAANGVASVFVEDGLLVGGTLFEVQGNVRGNVQKGNGGTVDIDPPNDPAGTSTRRVSWRELSTEQ
jgi:hypothetical protein